MSLLNDVLRDLVQQQKLSTSTTDNNHYMLNQTQLLTRHGISWLPSIIIFMVVFVVVLAIKHVFFVVPAVSIAPAPVSAPAPSLYNVVNPVISNAEKTKMSVATDVITPTIITNLTIPTVNKFTPVDDALQYRIADLLQQANRALMIDRLTSPIEDNAYSYYQKILQVSPENAQAIQGLEMIAGRYLIKAREQLSLGNRTQADTFIQRAFVVAPEFTRQHDISNTEHVVVNSGITPESQTVLSATSISSVNASVESPIKPFSETTEVIKPFVVAEAQTLNVVPNAGWKDEQSVLQAEKLIQQGNVSQALKALKNFVSTEVKPVQSTLLLADIYLQQGNTQAVEALLSVENYLNVVEKTKIKAQVLVAQNNEIKAIEILEQQLPAAENNEKYRALLASLYHKTGQYQQSVVHYRRLLNSFGEQPAYWLGLALAFDGLTEYHDALQAYQHLREFPQLQEQVKIYIDQRIAALRSK